METLTDFPSKNLQALSPFVIFIDFIQKYYTKNTK